MSNNYPFHRAMAKPATFVPTNYYGCDPYNTVDAAVMKQRVLRTVKPTVYGAPLQTWTQARYIK